MEVSHVHCYSMTKYSLENGHYNDMYCDGYSLLILSTRSLNVLKKEGGELKLHGVMFNRAEQKEPVASSDTK